MREFGVFEVILIMIAICLATFCSVKIYDFRDYGSRISDLEMDIQHLEESAMGVSQ